jgi:hypothetical protein
MAGVGSSEIFINFAALVLVRAAVSPATAAKPPTRCVQCVRNTSTSADLKKN